MTLPGEEAYWPWEGWRPYLRETFAAGKRTFLPPRGDGSNWWLNPQVVSSVLLGIIMVLLLINFGEYVRAAPRKITHRFRRALLRRKRRLQVEGGARKQLAQRSKRVLRRLTQPRAERAAAGFADARTLLHTRLDAMVGLAGIKAHLLTLLDTLEMDERRRLSMPSFSKMQGCMHMVFLGSPGTGKTAVAELVALVLNEIGVLRRGHLVVAKKADLLGRYSNHVSRNTRSIVRSALGGVLFIDEAYSLLQGEVELGREVINVLVDMCYAHRDDLVVILAGYTDSVSELFHFNPGLASRFPHKFAFHDYTGDELCQIAERMLAAAHFELAGGTARADARAALARLVQPVTREVPCGNARSVENRIAMTISMQSKRLRGDTEVAAGEGLFQLTAADLDEACAVSERANAVLGRTAATQEADGVGEDQPYLNPCPTDGAVRAG